MTGRVSSAPTAEPGSTRRPPAASEQPRTRAPRCRPSPRAPTLEGPPQLTPRSLSPLGVTGEDCLSPLLYKSPPTGSAPALPILPTTRFHGKSLGTSPSGRCPYVQAHCWLAADQREPGVLRTSPALHTCMIPHKLLLRLSGLSSSPSGAASAPDSRCRDSPHSTQDPFSLGKSLPETGKATCFLSW